MPIVGMSTRPARSATEDLKAANRLEVTTDASRLKEADVVIVAVPTPIDEAHQPDFSPLVGASISVGRNLKKGATVVYESTVYPGATEEVCIPLLERESGLKWKKDFFVGYSPERINPGDREHTLTRIVKVVSGDTPETLERVARDLRARDHGRCAPGLEHRGRRGRQGDREHAARPEHRADERTRADLPQDRHRHARSAAGRRHEVELPAVSPRPRRRPLHRRRSVLPDAQGRQARLSPAGDPRGPAHQRRHGQVRRRTDREEPDPGRQAA